jgi:hypothetical protein
MTAIDPLFHHFRKGGNQEKFQPNLVCSRGKYYRRSGLTVLYCDREAAEKRVNSRRTPYVLTILTKIGLKNRLKTFSAER